MKTIGLTQGKVALVDDEDHARVLGLHWCAMRDGHCWYAVQSARVGQSAVWMHRLILPPPVGMEIDHINHDGLDNRRCNLRIASRSQNNANARLRRDSSSGFKGVYLPEGRSKWQAHIRINGRQTYLGVFDTPEDAARAYDSAARESHGEFALVNFPVGGSTDDRP